MGAQGRLWRRGLGCEPDRASVRERHPSEWVCTEHRLTNSPSYRLRCQGCGKAFEDDGFILECPVQHEPALLATEYEEGNFNPDVGAEGMFRYRQWLPGRRVLPGAGSGAVYKSERLNRITGLSNLWVVFNGYWPEKGATLETTTFKDLEAWSVISRIPEHHEEVLVVASAGNTAAAFARACSLNEIPCLILIPETGLPNLRFPDALDPCVKVVSLTGADYSDAIALADRISQISGFFPEGGVKNVARRDGLGTVVLEAVEKIGQMPRYYFQAIGSGTGGIAAYEAAKRLAGDGRFGTEFPRLMLSQNLPYAPIYESWKSRRRELVEIGDDGRRRIQRIAAGVLSNRRPAYSTRGGISDVLTETGGDMLAADNRETFRAKQLFEEAEGIDIDPAGAVAFATLIKAARYGRIEREAPILLNITGGGRHRRQLDQKLSPAQPTLELDEKEISLDKIPGRIAGLFR